MTFSKVRIQKRKDSRMKTYRPGVNVWAMFMIFLLVLSGCGSFGKETDTGTE